MGTTVMYLEIIPDVHRTHEIKNHSESCHLLCWMSVTVSGAKLLTV